MHLFLSTLFLVLSACGDDSDRQENIAKVRGLGMSSNPLVSIPSTDSDPKTMDLTFFVAAPLGETLQFEKFMDDPTSSALLLDPSQYELGTNRVHDYKALRVVEMHVTAKVPTTNELPPVGGRVRVGVRIRGSKNEEKFVGTFLVVPPANKTALEWKAPTVDIADPSADAANIKSGNTVPLQASLTDPNQEEWKVGWFSSAGQITNRRSLETYWKTSSTGPQTLIVTVRAKRSLGFAMKVLEVNVQ